MSLDGAGAVRSPMAGELLPSDTNAGTSLSKAALKGKDVQAKDKAKSAKAHGDGIEKPKQSKSRNGCVTCKQKRLKCDETKPTCQQCSKRGVVCGGYKKDFKWRPFEEASLVFKHAAPTKAKKSETFPLPSMGDASSLGGSSSDSPEAGGSTQQTSRSPTNRRSLMPLIEESSPSCPSQTDGGDRIGIHAQGLALRRSPDQEIRDLTKSLEYPASQESMAIKKSKLSPASLQISDLDDIEPLNSPASLQDLIGPPTLQGTEDAEIIVSKSQEQWAVVHSVIEEPSDPRNLDFRFYAPLLNCIELKDDHAEMLLGTFDKDTCGILSIRDGPHENPWRTSIMPLVHESEALYHALAAVTAFHASTLRPELKRVGIDHIRRSAQLLARDISHMRPDIALALTLVLAFAESWDVQVTTGIKHLQGARHFLQQARPIARQLGPANSFSQRIRFLQNTWAYADVIARLTSLNADDSTDFDAAYEADITSQTDASGNPTVEIDPLMGSAASLFPLIGRVANLIRKVRLSTKTSPMLISEAAKLQAALIHWSPPACLIEPEDATCLAGDAVRTAEAYRWATLLFLHQAVPELPSLSARELARNALVHIAVVPPHSHTTIIHIYPMLAAGCEAMHPADREWVVRRWLAMSRRMLIGNIDRCVEVVREVWVRRDEAQGPNPKACSGMPIEHPCWNLTGFESTSVTRDNEDGSAPLFWTDPLAATSSTPNVSLPDFPLDPRSPQLSAASNTEIEQLPCERTVRGKHHWVGIMEQWNWEGTDRQCGVHYGTTGANNQIVLIG